MEKNNEFLEAFGKITKEIIELSTEDFEKMLKDHEDGEISKMLQECWKKKGEN